MTGKLAPAGVQACVFILILLVKEEKVIQNSYSGRRVHHEPPCVTQGLVDRPGEISPPKNPFAKSARQELLYPQGRWLVQACDAAAACAGTCEATSLPTRGTSP